MKPISLIFFLLALPSWLWSQQPDPGLPLPQSSLRVAALGSLIYPGFKIGIERPYRVIRRESGGTFQQERSLIASLGYYHHGTFHDNLFLVVERQKRFQWRSGWFVETAPGAGVSRTFLGGTTYTVSENGEVRKRTLAGHTYALVSVSCGGGYHFAARHGKPLSVFSKVSLLGMFPGNSFVYLRPAIELGCSWMVPGLLPSSPTVKLKKK